MERPPLPESSSFRIRLNTFRDLWRRGYYLTCGLKFGCDYLAYEALPGKVSVVLTSIRHLEKQPELCENDESYFYKDRSSRPQIVSYPVRVLEQFSSGLNFMGYLLLASFI